MARVSVEHGIGDLARDCAAIPVQMVEQGSRIIKRDIRAGRTLARKSARKQSPRSGQHYDDAITDEMLGALDGEFGPDPSLPQGGMDFEHGSGRQDAPHNNLAKAADVVGPKFHRDIAAMVDDLFWPGGDQ